LLIADEVFVKKIIFLLSLVFAVNSYSTVLVISDIDDTIKVSSVRKSAEMILNYKTKSQFTGMSELYRLLKSQYQDEFVINYVTGAPNSILGLDSVMKSHLEFLKLHLFPTGSVYFKDGLYQVDYKLETIRKIVAETNPDTIILLGDNGQKDEPIYFQLKKEFERKGIKTHILIHRIHSNNVDVDRPLYSGSVFSYLTSVEIAAYLNKVNIFSDDNYKFFVNLKLNRIINDRNSDMKKNGEISFPKFLNCVDYQWTLDLSPDLMLLRNEIIKRCQK
jgi:Uncharacterized conserved protein (DUF2183)